MAFSLQGFIDNSIPTIKAAWLNAVDTMYALGRRTNAGTPITLANSQWQVTDSANNYSSMDINNQSAGTSASSDFVATANTGTDTTQFVNMGINGSAYSVAGWTVNGALDAYVYASDGNMAIGTAAAKRLDFFVGGTLAANIAMTISSAGVASLAASPATSDNSTKIATTAYVKAQTSVGALLNIINFTAQTQALTSISNATPAVLTCTSAYHLPETGSPIQLTTSGTLPTGLSLATTYYVTNPSGSTYNVCLTYADALAGTNKVATSSAGSGTHTMNSIYVKNASSSFVITETWGAGGGGGGVSAVSSAVGAGGGAGGFVRRKVATASLAATETITIGAGGTAGANTGGTGGTGGTSSFGSWATATGGVGGVGSTSASTSQLGGAGGAGASGDINLTGAPGLQSVANNLLAMNISGTGGNTTLGGAGIGRTTNVDAAGADAVRNSGSGGSGAAENGGAHVGGVGGSGRVIIWEYS